MSSLHFFSSALVAFCLAGTAAAQSNDSRVALGVNAGTTGLGLQAQFKVSPKVTLRAGFDALKFGAEVDGDAIVYDGELDFATGGAFVDFHPTGGAFLLSAGAYFGSRELSVSGTPALGTTVEVGDEKFTSAQVGTLKGNLNFGDTAPFIGLGWDTTFTPRSRVGFKFIAGAAFGSAPDATLLRSGGIQLSAAEQARFDRELRDEEVEIEAKTDDFTMFPVVQVGLFVRF
jgi:hypothetical protein